MTLGSRLRDADHYLERAAAVLAEPDLDLTASQRHSLEQAELLVAAARQAVARAGELRVPAQRV